LCLSHAEHRVFRRQPDVTHLGNREAASEAVAIYGADQRFSRMGPAVQAMRRHCILGACLYARGIVLVSFPEVAARTESPTRAGDHSGAQVVVIIEARERFSK